YHGSFHRLFPLGNFHLKTKTGKLLTQCGEVGLQRKARFRIEEREIKSFRKPWQTMKDAQASPTVKGGLIKNTCSLQTRQGQLLHDLSQGMRIVFTLCKAITSQHLFDHLHCKLSSTRQSACIWRDLWPDFTKCSTIARSKEPSASSSSRRSSNRKAFITARLVASRRRVKSTFSHSAFSGPAIRKLTFS